MRKLHSLLHNNNFLLFLIGQNTSVFGDILLSAGFSLYVLLATKSAFQLSIALAITFIPRIFISPYAGVIVDRLPKKKLVILLDSLRAIWLFLLYGLIAHNDLSLWMIYVTLAFFAICDTFFAPSFMSIFTKITPKKALQDANALMTTAKNIVSVISPVVASLLFNHYGIAFLLLIDGITFLISALLECFMSFEDTLKASSAPIHQELSEIINYIRQHIQLSSLLTNGILTHLFLFPFIEIGVMHLLLITFKAPETDYGLLQSTISIAAILAGAIALYYGNRNSVGNNINIGIIGMVIAVFIFELMISKDFRAILMITKSLPTIYLCVGCFVIFLSFHFYGVFFASYYQQEVPSVLIGRYTALMIMCFSVARLLGMFLYGFLFDRGYLTVGLITLFIGMTLKIFVHIPFLHAEKIDYRERGM